MSAKMIVSLLIIIVMALFFIWPSLQKDGQLGIAVYGLTKPSSCGKVLTNVCGGRTATVQCKRLGYSWNVCDLCEGC